MGRNEIRLRRQMMNAGRIAQHRNYSELMARHEREVKLKRITRVVIYFLIIAFLLVMFMMINRISKPKDTKQPSESISLVTTDKWSATNQYNTKY